MRVKIKTVVDLLTSSARGGVGERRKIGMLLLVLHAHSLLACFAHRLIDLKKICAHVFSMCSSTLRDVSVLN